MALADTANLAVKITLDDRGFTGPLSRIQRNLGGLNKSFGRVGKGVGQLGLGFARVGYTAAVAAAGGLAIVAREGVKWESALAGVNKTMDLTPTELQAIGTEIRVLATQIPIGADAIAGLAEQAGALGIAKDDVVEFAKVAATLGVTTNVSADQAASSLGVMSNLLKLTGSDYERFASALVDLGNKGASTEAAILAIAERAAGAGATIGLTTDEILGFSSAVANVGIEPEAGGSSLQKFFIETLKMVNEGAGGLERIAEVAGVTKKEITDAFKGDPGRALQYFIQGLSELSKGQRLDVLEDLGFSDIRITRMLLGLAEAEKNNDNLAKSLSVSEAAWHANTAAAEEADKRYKTVGSKLELLKNQAIEGALLIGEGFLPALGRMADKLKGILADPEQRKVFTDFGKDIGSIIDGIDFQKVLAGAKTFLEVAKTIWGILRQIPIEIHAAVLGFAALNKLSGGLIGAGVENIVGGLAGAGAQGLASRAPGIGRLFAQPVFVTNWPIGGVVGGGGGTAVAGAARGGIGVLGKLFLVGEAIGLIAAVNEVKNAVSGAATEQAQAIHTTLSQSLAGPQSLDQLNQKLAGINQGIQAINPDNKEGGVFRGAQTELEAMRTQVVAAIRAQTAVEKVARDDVVQIPAQITAKQKASFERLRARIEAARIATVNVSQKEQAKLAALRVGQALAKAAQIAAGHSDKNSIVAAIRSNRPIVSVVVNAATNYSTIVKTGMTTTRAGGKFGNKQVPL